MLKHEQQSIAKALIASLDHSAGPRKVEMQQNAALRGQTKGARARECKVKETREAPRRQTTPHVASLSAAAADGVDAEEEEERKAEKEWKDAKRLNKALREAAHQHYPWVQSPGRLSLAQRGDLCAVPALPTVIFYSKRDRQMRIHGG